MTYSICTSLLFAMVMVSGCTTTASRDAAFHEDSALSQVNTDNTLNLVTRLEEADRALREARLNDAEVMYRELIKSHPQVPEVYLRLGNIYTRQAQLEAAQQTYKEGEDRNGKMMRYLKVKQTPLNKYWDANEPNTYHN